MPNFDGDEQDFAITEDVVFNKVLGGCTDPDSWDTLTYTFEIDGENSLPDCFGFDSNSFALSLTNCAVPMSFNAKLICTDDNFYEYGNGN